MDMVFELNFIVNCTEGTHVVGSIVGESKEQPHFNGIMPKAKVVFVDMGLPSGVISLFYYSYYFSN